jgi:DASS family divalent anion:Na+ symporter
VLSGSFLIQAWDTLFWFAILVGMSSQLNSQGVVAYFSDSIGGKLTAMNLGWPAVFGLLNLVYFGLHYIFASQTAHVGALYAAFLAMMVASGSPPPPSPPPPSPGKRPVEFTRNSR